MDLEVPGVYGNSLHRVRDTGCGCDVHTCTCRWSWFTRKGAPSCRMGKRNCCKDVIVAAYSDNAV